MYVLIQDLARGARVPRARRGSRPFAELTVGLVEAVSVALAEW
jgi:hypothetical protein